MGYKAHPAEPCVFVKTENGETCTLCLYVDDIFGASTSDALMNEVTTVLKEHRRGKAGSDFTKQYAIINLLFSKELKYYSEENILTFLLMKKFGLNLVRGGSYCNLIYEETKLDEINARINNLDAINVNLDFTCEINITKLETIINATFEIIRNLQASVKYTLYNYDNLEIIKNHGKRWCYEDYLEVVNYILNTNLKLEDIALKIGRTLATTLRIIKRIYMIEIELKSFNETLSVDNVCRKLTLKKKNTDADTDTD